MSFRPPSPAVPPSRLLERATDVWRQPRGKPFAIVKGAAHPVAFNVSHSGQHGLVALAQGGSLGVDVEERRQRIHREGIAARMFAPEERDVLSRLPEERRLSTFYRFWTLREAVGKALGCGLAWAPAAFVLPRAIRCGAASGIVTLNAHPGHAGGCRTWAQPALQRPWPANTTTPVRIRGRPHLRHSRSLSVLPVQAGIHPSARPQEGPSLRRSRWR